MSHHQEDRYLRVHGHGGELGEDVFAGSSRGVTGEGLGRGHLVPAAELQRTAAVHLLHLGQVGLGRYHHTRSLAVHEVLLRWSEVEESKQRGG